MIDRRLFIAMGAAVTAGAAAFPAAATGTVHEVNMLNKGTVDTKARNVFEPAVLRVQPGDTVKFISVDKGHNSESIDDMLPDGSEEWKSKVGRDFEITFDKPGVYGYKCTPHYTLGMVGVVIVEGEGWDANLEAAQKVKHRGRAAKNFDAIWEEVAAAMTN